MSIQSDISSFIDQINLNEDEPSSSAGSTTSFYLDPLQKYQSIDMYELLLRKDSTKNSTSSTTTTSTMTTTPNTNDIENKLSYYKQFHYQTASRNYNAPINTINPRKLSSHTVPATISNSSYITSSTSDLDYNTVLEDSNSVSSLEDLNEVTDSIKKPSINWSMNDEFKNAIQTWLNENEIKSSTSNNGNHASTSTSKRNSISEHVNRSPFQRTSISKRRKSDSSVAFRPNSLINLKHNLQSSHLPHTSSASSTDPSSLNHSSSSFPYPTSTNHDSSAITTSSSQPSASSTSSTKSSTPTATLSNSVQFSGTTNINNSISTNNNASTSSTTITSSSLNTLHDGSPEEEKPFKCENCTKAFRRSEHLKRHIRSVHSNIRPFPCKFCDKKFSRSDNLAQHLRTHTKHS